MLFSSSALFLYHLFYHTHYRQRNKYEINIMTKESTCVQQEEHISICCHVFGSHILISFSSPTSHTIVQDKRRCPRGMKQMKNQFGVVVSDFGPDPSNLANRCKFGAWFPRFLHLALPMAFEKYFPLKSSKCLCYSLLLFLSLPSLSSLSHTLQTKKQI